MESESFSPPGRVQNGGRPVRPPRSHSFVRGPAEGRGAPQRPCQPTGPLARSSDTAAFDSPAGAIITKGGLYHGSPLSRAAGRRVGRGLRSRTTSIAGPRRQHDTTDKCDMAATQAPGRPGSESAPRRGRLKSPLRSRPGLLIADHV